MRRSVHAALARAQTARLPATGQGAIWRALGPEAAFASPLVALLHQRAVPWMAPAARRRAAPLARGRNPASAAEGIIPDMRAWYCIGSIIGDLQSQRAVPGRPPRRAAAGRLAAEAENCEEPWRPLGAPKWNSKPCTAFVTSCTVCIHAPAPKQAIPQNRYSGAAHPDRANAFHPARSLVTPSAPQRGLNRMGQTYWS